MRTKSLLLVPVLLTLSGVIGFALFQIGTGHSLLPWTGVMLAASPLPVMVTYLMLTERLARTSANLPFGLAFSAAGTCLTFISQAGVLPIGLALAALAGLIWYVFSYSRYGRTASTALAVGRPLPAFTLEDASGDPVTSASFAGAPNLFLFFRGNWCPLCMAQIREVADAYKRLAGLGVKVILVSPQPHDQTAKLAAKFDVPFHFLVDKGLQAARKLDIFAEGGTPAGIDAMGYGEDTVLPTVIATDASGKIIFLDETDNYRVRPEPETFLKIFETHDQMEVMA